MKKISCLLAIILISAIILPSCSNTDSNVSFPLESDAGTIESSETIESDESVSNVEKDPLEVFTKTEVSDSPNRSVISTNASYTKSVEADQASYPDSYGTELTDGITCVAQGNFNDGSLSGYTDDSLDVTVDLGANFDKIYAFEVGYYSTTGGGIGAPWMFTVSASNDCENWKVLGNMTHAEFVEGAVVYATLTMDTYINARYIRFNMKSAYPWMFLDEVMVIADADENEGDIVFAEAVHNAYEELGVISPPSDGGTIDRTLDKVLVSEGASYTTTGTEHDKFSDAEKSKLTDGRKSGYYEGGTWVGYTDKESVTVKLNLGKTVEDIAAVEASFFVNSAIKIYMPTAVKVTAIDNKNHRTELGIIYGNTLFTNGDYTFALPLRNSISARYIEFTIYLTDSTMLLVDELAVYSYREVNEKTLYPEISFNSDDSGWGSESSDEYVNLISGLKQQIFTYYEPTGDNLKSYYNTPVTSKLLTDGVFSSENEIHNGQFFKFHMGTGRKVIYDLGHLSSVDKFTASFTNVTEWAVYAPDYMFIYISENGEDWYNVGELVLSGKTDNEIYKGELVLDKKLKARYVAFDFVVKTWAGCDELEVYGAKTVKGAVSADDAGYESVDLHHTERKAPSEDLLDGSKDLCLLYYTDLDKGYTVDDLLPYLAYLDKDGNIVDTMFDSFLFLCNGHMPYGNPQTGSYKSDWDWSNEHLFTEGINVLALEEAAGRVKEALNLDDDYKFNVTMTLYYPSPTVTDFGDVDGDGVSEDLSLYENRMKVIKWYIDDIEKRYKDANFQNIELVGYYWWHEDVLDGDADIRTLINDISDYVDEVDKDFFWIPWYSSPGFNLWEMLSFDVACMQPNYVFDADVSLSNIKNCADITKVFGMGIEIEIQNDCLWNEFFYEKYMAYLAGGAEYGYMKDAVNMYYQSIYVYRDAAYSDDLMARSVYDYTYEYIKDSITNVPPAIDNLKFEAVKNEIFTGTIDFEEDRLRQLQVSLVADHGTVTMNNDGTFVYYPEKDYTGEVTFSFVYNEYLGWSEPCEVTINVK